MRFWLDERLQWVDGEKDKRRKVWGHPNKY